MPTPENGKRKNSTVDGGFESQIYKKGNPARRLDLKKRGKNI